MNFFKSCSKLEITVFAAIYSVFTLLLFHKALLDFSLANLDYHSSAGVLIIMALALAQFVAVFVLVILLSFIPYALKPLAALFLLMNSVAFYFVTKYNVILDKTMMSNVFNTNFAEASELYNIKIIFYILLLGILPSILLLKIKIIAESKKKRFGAIVVSVIILVIFAYLNSKSWLWFDKNAKRLGGLSMPFSYVGNSIRYASSKAAQNRQIIKIPDAQFISDDKTLVVLVIGESARAANFSLYGYARNTNQNLAKDHVIALPNTTSCTTYTTESIKCMLSHLGSKAPSRTLFEALPDYLKRSGVEVLWRSNNWGEPKMDLVSIDKPEKIKQTCRSKECDDLTHDGVLLADLDKILQNSADKNSFVVLHQAGSHGPSYHEKYPPNFELFKPVCKSVELQKCSAEELLNAYDNTIVYTDYFLDRLIKILRSLHNRSVMMIYISDHGESLGERGFYLHGTPYAIAPDMQKQIPFIIWMSDRFKKDHNLSDEKVLNKSSHHSQDNVFHSVMGAFGMRSEFYDQKLDLFNIESSAAKK